MVLRNLRVLHRISLYNPQTSKYSHSVMQINRPSLLCTELPIYLPERQTSIINFITSSHGKLRILLFILWYHHWVITTQLTTSNMTAVNRFRINNTDGLSRCYKSNKIWELDSSCIILGIWILNFFQKNKFHPLN